MVSFSTDPENDTPTVLKAYAKRFGAAERWIFLTGPKEQVYDLIKHGFLLPVAAPAGRQIIHSTKMHAGGQDGDGAGILRWDHRGVGSRRFSRMCGGC